MGNGVSNEFYEQAVRPKRSQTGTGDIQKGSAQERYKKLLLLRRNTLGRHDAPATKRSASTSDLLAAEEKLATEESKDDSTRPDWMNDDIVRQYKNGTLMKNLRKHESEAVFVPKKSKKKKRPNSPEKPPLHPDKSNKQEMSWRSAFPSKAASHADDSDSDVAMGFSSQYSSNPTPAKPMTPMTPNHPPGGQPPQSEAAAAADPQIVPPSEGATVDGAAEKKVAHAESDAAKAVSTGGAKTPTPVPLTTTKTLPSSPPSTATSPSPSTAPSPSPSLPKEGKQDELSPLGGFENKTKKKAKKKPRFRRVNTQKLLIVPEKRYLNAMMARPEGVITPDTPDAQMMSVCAYCGVMNDNTMEPNFMCPTCGIANSDGSPEDLLRRSKKAQKVIAHHKRRNKPDDCREIAKRWLGRATHIEMQAHKLLSDDKPEKALQLLTAHMELCGVYWGLRTAYVAGMNSLLTMHLVIGDWDAGMAIAKRIYELLTTQLKYSIPPGWTSPFSGLPADPSPFQCHVDEHPLSSRESSEMDLQFVVLLMGIQLIHLHLDQAEAALLVDEFTLKFAEESASSESLCCIRRRLTILNEVYLSRGKNQNEFLSKAAPLSRQLFISVMDSSELMETPLLVSACSVQALSVVEVLLAGNMGSTYAQLERQDVNGCTALHMACASPSRSARAPLAKMLLDARSDPNAQDTEGCTALHYAATASDTALVALLMLQGADPSIADNYNTLPADYAAQIGDAESQLLLQPTSSPHANNQQAQFNSEWVQCWDADANRAFFINTVTGQSEWVSEEQWETEEQQLRAQLNTSDMWTYDAEAADKYINTPPIKSSGAYTPASSNKKALEYADKRAWSAVAGMRKTLTHLANVAGDTMKQRYEETKEAVAEESQYDVLLAEQEASIARLSKELEMVSESGGGDTLMADDDDDSDELLADSSDEEGENVLNFSNMADAEANKKKAAELAKKEAELAERKKRQQELKAELERLKQQYLKSKKEKDESLKKRQKADIKLEVTHAVAMKQKARIIDSFKKNVKQMNESMASARSMHKNKLMEKLALRRKGLRSRVGRGRVSSNPSHSPNPQRKRVSTPPLKTPSGKPISTLNAGGRDRSGSAWQSGAQTVINSARQSLPAISKPKS